MNLPIPENTEFTTDFYDFGHKVYVGMNYRNGLIRHAVGTDHFITHESQLVNKKIVEDCSEELLKWFWRKLGAA